MTVRYRECKSALEEGRALGSVAEKQRNPGGGQGRPQPLGRVSVMNPLGLGGSTCPGASEYDGAATSSQGKEAAVHSDRGGGHHPLQPEALAEQCVEGCVCFGQKKSEGTW